MPFVAYLPLQFRRWYIIALSISYKRPGAKKNRRFGCAGSIKLKSNSKVLFLFLLLRLLFSPGAPPTQLINARRVGGRPRRCSAAAPRPPQPTVAAAPPALPQRALTGFHSSYCVAPLGRPCCSPRPRGAVGGRRCYACRLARAWGGGSCGQPGAASQPWPERARHRRRRRRSGAPAQLGCPRCLRRKGHW